MLKQQHIRLKEYITDDRLLVIENIFPYLLQWRPKEVFVKIRVKNPSKQLLHRILLLMTIFLWTLA